MNYTLPCSIALAISLSLVVAAIAIAYLLHRAELEKTELEGRRILTSFHIFAIFFFIAAVVVYFPLYYMSYLSATSGFAKFFDAVLLAVQNVLRLITLNGEFDNVREFFLTLEGNAALGTFYSAYIAVIMVAAPVLTAGVVLTFFKNASAMLRYTLTPCRELYIFSELNERSLALAKDIMRGEKHGRGGKLIVFTDVFERNAEREYELVLAAKQCGAICVKKDVIDIGFKRAQRKCTRKVYLIGDNQDENIRQALTLISRCRRIPALNTPALQFYVFSDTVESEILLNSVDNGEMKVRRVSESRNFAIQEMLDHPIFTHADGDKHIRMAIVGFGGYGTELLKAMCWCGQMPGYTLEVHVFGIEKVEERLRALAPELTKLNKNNVPTEANYEIVYHPELDVLGEKFLTEISSIGMLSGVYVTLGDDELNIATAMKIRTARMRTARTRQPQGEITKEPIYAVVYSTAKSDTVSSDEKGHSLEIMQRESYDIIFIGSLRERYCLKSVERPELEADALEMHLSWAKKNSASKETLLEEERLFNRYEYYRKTSTAQAVYRKLRMGLGIVKKDESTPEGHAYNDMLREYEHRRWSTYLRTEGYEYWAEERSHVAKAHPLLVSFERLPDDEKNKDDF